MLALVIGFTCYQHRPIVQNPPLEEGKPAMCCKDTVLITPRTAQQKILFKTSQRRYWGSKDWQETYKLRGSIERFFGHAKVHHGLVPEAHYFKGLGIATLCTSISIASTNISKMRKWASNEDTHPNIHSYSARRSTTTMKNASTNTKN